MSECSIAFDLDPDRGFVRIQIRGRLTPEAGARMQSEVTTAYPGRHRLWDFREADLSAWTAADMHSFIDAVAARESSAHPTRAAALVSRDLDYGISRMFEALSHGKLERTVFRVEADAEAWLSSGG